MNALLPPPFTPRTELDRQLARHGHAVLSPQAIGEALDVPLHGLQALLPFWERLPHDAHLKDGGRYRRRRHACFVASQGEVALVPHRAHWQPVEYNALHGGIERWFEPAEPAMLALPAWNRLLLWLAERADLLRGARQRWFIEAHPFRIDTAEGIGRPTPEGAHRDGVDLVMVMLLARERVKGGETRVFEADGPNGQRFTMEQPFTTLLLDDARVIHETTPIQPAGGGYGHRDTLVVTLRRDGFQGPDSAH